MKTAWMLLAIVLALASNAEACNRCGKFGSHCQLSHFNHHPHVVHHDVAKVVEHQRDKVVVVTNVIGVPVPTTYGFLSEPGNTLYGYQHHGFPSLQQYATPKQVDFAAVFARAGKTMDGALQVVREANQGSLQLAGQLGADAAQVASLQAAGQANAQLLQAAAANRGTYSLSVNSNGQVSVNNNQPPPQDGSAATLQGLVQSQCIGCHQREKVKLDLSQIASFSREELKGVIDRVTTLDANRRMPPGGSLSPDQMDLLFQARRNAGE